MGPDCGLDMRRRIQAANEVTPGWRAIRKLAWPPASRVKAT